MTIPLPSVCAVLVLQGKRTGPLADVFAFAVILWELLT